MTANDIEKVRAKSCHELMEIALAVKIRHRGSRFSLCSIINAKSGQCSENCRFCAQSAHFKTTAPVYPLLDKATVLKAAVQAKEDQAEHFSLVTSGRGLGSAEVQKIAEIILAIRSEVGIAVCSSLGILKKEDFLVLKDAGMTRYHHNLETSKEFFPQVVTTHTFAERVETIVAAQSAGLEVCAGGIFGLGETEEDRVSMALTLRDLQVDSVPINILIPLPGTPLANQLPLTSLQILRAIALYRIILQDVPVRLAAGRESALQDFLSSAFMAGADGMMIGGYLTERGRAVEKDLEFVRQIRKLWDC
jgi:biotin synthase